ncbi:Bor family protein [Moraxella marmotae]|uniref:Bor family protein n=1 Tax=Moraxella marmotae TaxID=3344520 RepID=UPI0035F242B3
MKKIAFASMMALVMTGCASQTAYLNGTTAQTTPATPTYSKSERFFVAGIGQERTVDAAGICGGANNVATVQSSWQPKDIALGIVTFGIYTPRTSKVYCK